MGDGCNDRYNDVCKGAFASLHTAIKDTNKANAAQHNDLRKILLGNGEAGFATRLDRLEQAEAKRDKLKWIVVAAVTGLVLNSGIVAYLLSRIP